jgi:two-component system invasion response regulator UvrY
MLDVQSPIKVLCVDDNQLVADAIAARVRGAMGFQWIGSLPTADALIDAVPRDGLTIVLLDVDMPGCNPFEAMQQLLERRAESRVIVFSGHVRRDLLDHAVRSGAWGYISKNDGGDALLEGICSVASGEFALSPEVRAVCELG